MRGIGLLTFLISLQAASQSPDFNRYQIEPASSLSFKIKGCFLSKSCYDKQHLAKAEVPPWTTTLINQHYYFLVNGRATYTWTHSQSLIQSFDLKLAAAKPHLSTLPYISTNDYQAGLSGFDWKRNYHAIYTAQVVEQAAKGTILIGFCHGENKNEVFSVECSGSTVAERVYNTIQPNIPIDCSQPDTWSGGRPYHDGWDAYNGILSAVWTTPLTVNTDSIYRDIGPIAWPSMAYMTSDSIKTTNGLRHPSSISYGDSIYVFYVEAGVYKGWTPSEEGRTGGVKVVRVHKNQVLVAQAYQAYYRDPSTGKQIWQPSLPQGFRKEQMLQYVARKGPKTTDILSDNNSKSDPVRFSVAKVQGTKYFISVEEYRNWDASTYYLAIRYSDNLVDWSLPHIIYSAPSWEAFLFHYPVFLNQSGTSNTEIDKDAFYIIGTPGNWGYTVNRLHLSCN